MINFGKFANLFITWNPKYAKLNYIYIIPDWIDDSRLYESLSRIKIGSYFDGVDFNFGDIINLSALSDERQKWRYMREKHFYLAVQKAIKGKTFSFVKNSHVSDRNAWFHRY